MRIILCLLLTSFVLLLTALPALAKPVNDAIIAVVDDEVITLRDLKEYITSIYRQLKIEHHTPEEIQEIMATYERKGINQLIDDKLILAAASAKGLEIRPEIVDKRLKEIKSRYSNDQEFLEALNSQGITITDLKTKLINQMKARYIVDIEVKDKVFVNPQDVTEYYNKHRDEFTRKTKYNLQSIYISFDKGKQEARNSAAEARAKLAAGEDFDKVSKEHSELPSIGSVEQGQMVPAIENVIFNLKVDELSEPLEVDGGVYVFRVTGIQPGREETLLEAKNQIYTKLYDMQFQQKFKEWIEKLRQKSYVEIRE